MPLTVGIVDIAHGRPANGLRVGLDRSDGETWTRVADATTDESGRIDDWGGADEPDRPLRLAIDARQYYATLGLVSAQVDVTITVGRVWPGVVQHVPVLLAPFGYSTCTGTWS